MTQARSLAGGIIGVVGAVAFIALALGASVPAPASHRGPSAAAGQGSPATATSTSTQAARAMRVARGDYLATTMGCKDCHTPGYFYGASDRTRELSGSELGWSGPWGTSYPSNLTPDIQTGLGSWSDADIVRAIRTGIRPDRTVLRPPMPWPNFAVLTDDDVNAIVAYLRTLKPIRHQELPALPPSVEPRGPAFTLPPPPPWDAPRAATGTGSGAANPADRAGAAAVAPKKAPPHRARR